MEWSTANGYKKKIEDAVKKLEEIKPKLNSTLLVLDNNEATLDPLKTELQGVIDGLATLEQNLLNDATSMEAIYKQFE